MGSAEGFGGGVVVTEVGQLSGGVCSSGVQKAVVIPVQSMVQRIIRTAGTVVPVLIGTKFQSVKEGALGPHYVSKKHRYNGGLAETKRVLAEIGEERPIF